MSAESAQTPKGRAISGEVTRRRDAVERVVARVPDCARVRNAARVELKQAWRRGLAAGLGVVATEYGHEERVAAAAALLGVSVRALAPIALQGGRRS